jgi:hypothetical protein
LMYKYIFSTSLEIRKMLMRVKLACTMLTIYIYAHLLSSISCSGARKLVHCVVTTEFSRRGRIANVVWWAYGIYIFFKIAS